MTRTLTFEVDDDGVLSFGRRVYTVCRRSSRQLREKCPICDGVKKVVLKGREFACPNCGNSTGGISLFLYEYTIKEYIIHSVEIVGDTVKSHYDSKGRPVNGRLPRVVYRGFAKGAFSSFETRIFSSQRFKTFNNDLDAAFLSRTEAENHLKMLYEKQAEALRVFNAEHGTEHEDPFNIN